MLSQTAKEARWWCTQGGKSSRKLTKQDVLHYATRTECSFRIKTPPEHRMMVALGHDILRHTDESLFEGGLVWLTTWGIGSPHLVRTGWRIIEDMRRAHGDLRSLDIAPAQVFRHDEFVELHTYLLQVMAYGWSGYFVPSSGGEDYFLDFRTSDRFFCVTKSAEKLEQLYSDLKQWTPSKEIPRFPKQASKREAAANPARL